MGWEIRRPVPRLVPVTHSASPRPALSTRDILQTAPVSHRASPRRRQGYKSSTKKKKRTSSKSPQREEAKKEQAAVQVQLPRPPESSRSVSSARKSPVPKKRSVSRKKRSVSRRRGLGRGRKVRVPEEESGSREEVWSQKKSSGSRRKVRSSRGGDPVQVKVQKNQSQVPARGPEVRGRSRAPRRERTAGASASGTLKREPSHSLTCSSSAEPLEPSLRSTHVAPAMPEAPPRITELDKEQLLEIANGPRSGMCTRRACPSRQLNAQSDRTSCTCPHMCQATWP
ncbi:unnamed protein product [Boreogadus saida]